MTCTDFPVVVIGGGPTGIAAATLLGRYGVECLVLDRFTAVYPRPRAVHLDDEIFRIVARLGAAAELAKISRPAGGLQLRDNTMRVLAQFTRAAGEGPHGFPKANMFDQPDLESVLRANLDAHPSATVRGDVEVTAVASAGDHVVVEYIDRSDESRHSVRAQYVFGCDGANSIVRAAIGSSMRDFRFDQRWLVVDIATDADLQQWDGVQQICDPIRAATYMRIGPTRYRWEFRLLPGESATDFADLQLLRPLLAPWTADTAMDHLELVRVAEYTFRAQLADRWRCGRIFLLGDAAHLTPPFVGQGMGAGLRDAMNLSWKLAGVLAGSLPEPVLDTYERERKPHARAMILLALGMGKAMTEGGRIGDLARRAVAPRLQYVPGLRSLIAEGATPALRRSDFVVKSLVPWDPAGTLCPNAEVDGRRLDEVVGDRFAVVTVSDASPGQRAAIHRRGAVIVVAAPGTGLYRWLRRRRVTAALVRPDGTVMRAGRDLAPLCAALPAFPGLHSDLVQPQRKTYR